MNSARRPVATAMAGAFALLVGSVAASAQTTVDVDNIYSNVGVIMVWRVPGQFKSSVRLVARALNASDRHTRCRVHRSLRGETP